MTFESIGRDQYPYRDLSMTLVGAFVTGRSAAIKEEESPDPSPRLLIYHQQGAASVTIQDYARYLAELLNTNLDDSRMIARENPTCEDLIKQAESGAELVIVEQLRRSFMRRLLLGSPECRAIAQVKASVLVARQPRWPLKRLLFVTRGQTRDDPAVDWLVRLIRPSGAAVTVLALQPFMSALQCQTLYGQGLATWLTTYTPLGHQLRRIVSYLAGGVNDGRLQLRFRQGAPDWQICCEVERESYDLIITAADSASRWERRLPGEVVSPLLRWINQPVLIAKPPSANDSQITNN